MQKTQCLACSLVLLIALVWFLSDRFLPSDRTGGNFPYTRKDDELKFPRVMLKYSLGIQYPIFKTKKLIFFSRVISPTDLFIYFFLYLHCIYMMSHFAGREWDWQTLHYYTHTHTHNYFESFGNQTSKFCTTKYKHVWSVVVGRNKQKYITISI